MPVGKGVSGERPGAKESPGASLGVPCGSRRGRERLAARKVPVHRSCSSPQKTKQKASVSVCVGRGAAGSDRSVVSP